jgi:hypothetical protein
LPPILKDFDKIFRELMDSLLTKIEQLRQAYKAHFDQILADHFHFQRLRLKLLEG